jgi:transcription elongation factor Elf1
MPDDGEVNTDYTRELVCPYCGHVESDSWQIHGDRGWTSCSDCVETYEYIRNVKITYCTNKRRN